MSRPIPTRRRRIQSAISDIDDDRIDGVLSIPRASATVATTAERPGRRAGAQLIEVDFDDARNFGSIPHATGISGSTPGDGEVAITEDLADTLEVETGDEVVGYLYGQAIDLEVTQVLPRLGVAGYWRGFEQTSSNAFVAPGTFESTLAGQSAARSSGSWSWPPERCRGRRHRLVGFTTRRVWKRWLNIVIAALAAANIVVGFLEFGFRQATGALAIVTGALLYATATPRALWTTPSTPIPGRRRSPTGTPTAAGRVPARPPTPLRRGCW